MILRPLAAVTALLLATGLALVAAPASAGVDDFEFESMHVDYTLTRDADGTSRLRAVETLVAVFPDVDQNRGIVRDIPTTYTIDGFGRVPIGVEVVGVTNENGARVPYESDTWHDDDGTEFVQLALGTDDYVHGRTTYVIEWTAHDVVASFADTSDEFYWDINGTGWDQRFGSVTADIHLGAGLEETLTGRTACYAGSAGSTTPCDLERTADGFHLDGGELGPRQNVTVAIGFDTGTFTTGVPLERNWVVTVLPWVLLGILVAVTLLVILLRTLLWRHAPGRGIIIPEYEGPDDLGVMSAAELLTRPAAGLPAQIVRLAVEDVVRLVEDPAQPATRRFRLEMVDVAAAVTPADTRAVTSLFATKAQDGETLVLDRTDQKLGDRIAKLAGQAKSALHPEYLSRGPKSPLRRLIFWPAVAVLAASIGLAIWCGTNEVMTPLAGVAIPVGILWSLILIGFSGKPMRRTAKGTAAYEQLLGLRDYLRLAEADRLRVLQSPSGAERTRIDPADPAAVVKLYERLLPWAIVWGVESEWARELQARYDETTPPSQNLGFVAGYAGISTLGRSFTTSSFATTPPVSSSSGSGGGSFSGGSFGGGFSGGGGGGGGGGGR